jgi:hypothetical protein
MLEPFAQTQQTVKVQIAYQVDVQVIFLYSEIFKGFKLKN